jgi:hypothetical protein
LPILKFSERSTRKTKPASHFSCIARVKFSISIQTYLLSINFLVPRYQSSQTEQVPSWPEQLSYLILKRSRALPLKLHRSSTMDRNASSHSPPLFLTTFSPNPKRSRTIHDNRLFFHNYGGLWVSNSHLFQLQPHRIGHCHHYRF